MEMNLQLFGGRGAGARNAAGAGAGGNAQAVEENKQPKDYTEMVGMSVADIRDIRFMGNDDFRKFFNIPEANNYQVTAIKQILDGMMRHDKAYDTNRTPFRIERIDIAQDNDLKELRREYGMRNTAAPVHVSITTAPVTESAFIRYSDTKTRSFFVGAKGGFYTYGSGGKRIKVDSFDATYGKRY